MISQLVRVFGIAAIVLAVGTACTSVPLEALNEDQSAPTDSFRSAVASYFAAVHAENSTLVAALASSDSTSAGVQEVMTRYGGADFTVTAYDDGIRSGDGFVTVHVGCAAGGQATYYQAFDGRAGDSWQALMLTDADIPADNPSPPATQDDRPPAAASTIAAASTRATSTLATSITATSTTATLTRATLTTATSTPAAPDTAASNAASTAAVTTAAGEVFHFHPPCR